MKVRTLPLLVILLLPFQMAIFHAQQGTESSIYWIHPRGCFSGLGYSLSTAPNELRGPKLIYIGINRATHAECPIVYKGKVYVVNGSKDLLCIDYKTGSILRVVKGDFRASPSVYDGKVYIPDKERLRCFDAETGEERIEFEGEIGGVVLPPVEVDGKIIVACSFATKCYDAKTGKIIWESQGPLAPYGPYVYKDKIIVTGFSGNIICYDLSTGKILWNIVLSKVSQHFHASVFDDKVVYSYHNASSGKSFLEARNIDSGKLLWKTELINATVLWIHPAPAVAYGKIYIAAKGYKGTNLVLFCLKPSNGEILWRKSYLVSLGASPNEIAVADNKILVSTGSGVYCFDANSGDLLWKYSNVEIKGRRVYILSAPAVAEGYVFVIAGLGVRYKDYLLVFGSFKKPSSISVTSSKTKIEYGEDISFTVKLNPQRKTTIYVEVRYEDRPWSMYATLTTSTDGTATFTWKPDKAGKWDIRIRWPGDSEYEEASKVITGITVLKVTPSLSLASSSTAKFKEEYKLEIKPNPPIADVAVTIVYTSPSNKQYTHQCKSDEKGIIEDIFTFDEEGEWTITVKVHETTSNNAITQTFKIVIKKALSLTILPVILIVALIIAIIIIVIAVFLLIVRKRRARPTYPSSPHYPYYGTY